MLFATVVKVFSSVCFFNIEFIRVSSFTMGCILVNCNHCQLLGVLFVYCKEVSV